MKALFALCILGLSLTSYAGYSCTTSTGDVLTVTESLSKGVGAKLSSQTVSDYYKQNYGMKISTLESIIDPETKQYATEELSNGYLFTLDAPKSGDENLWSLELLFDGASKATASLVDMAGVEFKFELSCMTYAHW